MIKVGFIGTGNMGGALATAASKSENVELLLANKPTEVAKSLSEKIGGKVYDNNIDVVKDSDYLFLGVKPQMLSDLMDEIANEIANKKELVVVSMIAGRSISALEDYLGKDVAIIRIMPNILASVSQGIIMHAHNKNVGTDQIDTFLDFMKHQGQFIAMDEKLIPAGTGISGCGPAFAAMFIEALADGGVACGVPRQTAMEMAAQMVKGTAEYYLTNHTHPGAIKDMVCSPAGTTIEGVRTLEECGFRAATMDAVIATYEKDQSL